MEPDAFALSRSLTSPVSQDATLILDMGASSTDLVITFGGALRLARSIPIGGDTLVKAAEQNLSVDEKQAMQFVYKFGLIQDKLEGQVFKALSSTIDSLVSEIDKSIKFFTTRYNKQPVTKIVVTGRASVLPEFPVYLVNKTNIAVEIGNAWMNTGYPQNSHNDLMSVANQYGVASGLAQRVER
jgi:Tfp pilus assembly PilM family ATPase